MGDSEDLAGINFDQLVYCYQLEPVWRSRQFDARHDDGDRQRHIVALDRDLDRCEGVTINTGTIAGSGTVAVNLTATGAAKISTPQFSGALGIAGTITDSGDPLTPSVTTSDRILHLDAASAAHSVSFNNAAGCRN